MLYNKKAHSVKDAETEATETAAATDVPKTGVIGLGLLYGAGAIITGALSLKKKVK